jgi:hypothetical protein
MNIHAILNYGLVYITVLEPEKPQKTLLGIHCKVVKHLLDVARNCNLFFSEPR